MLNKKDIINILNNVLIKDGYKRKGNNWEKIGKDLSITINLQKSKYSNLYYINYGYIINKLCLNNTTEHYGGRLLIPIGENYPLEKIDELDKISFEEDVLNLENNIPEAKRISRLEEIIVYFIKNKIGRIETYHDLYSKILRDRKLMIQYCGVISTIVEDFLVKKSNASNNQE